jgi:hypothetical protein
VNRELGTEFICVYVYKKPCYPLDPISITEITKKLSAQDASHLFHVPS